MSKILRVLGKKEVPILLSGGCQLSGCEKDKKKPEPLYLHSRCHPSAPSFFAKTDTPVVVLGCSECSLPMFSIAVPSSVSEEDLRQKCHPSAAGWAMVTPENKIKFSCAECKEVYFETDIRECMGSGESISIEFEEEEDGE